MQQAEPRLTSDTMKDTKDDTDPKEPTQQSKSKGVRRSGRFQSQTLSSSAMFPPTSSSGVGLEEEAEAHLLRVLEERRARANAHDADWNPSVEGERPPLGRVSFQAAASVFSPELNAADEDNDEEHHLARDRFQNLATQLRKMTFQRKSNIPSSERPEAAETEQQKEGTDVFQGVGGMETQLGLSAFAQGDTITDQVISAAMVVDKNFKKDDDETASIASDSVYTEATDMGTEEELLPLTGASQGGHGSAARRRRKRVWHRRRKKCMKSLHKAFRCDRYWFAEVLNPISLALAFFRFVTTSWFARLGLPCLIVAFVLFYYLNNPAPDFIKGATISWWLVFVTRQTLTLQLAVVSQSVLIDAFAMKSRYAVSIFSPLLALCVISSKGWPFISACKLPSLCAC
jgi:hypothetical protein